MIGLLGIELICLLARLVFSQEIIAAMFILLMLHILIQHSLLRLFYLPSSVAVHPSSLRTLQLIAQVISQLNCLRNFQPVHSVFNAATRANERVDHSTKHNCNYSGHTHNRYLFQYTNTCNHFRWSYNISRRFWHIESMDCWI